LQSAQHKRLGQFLIESGWITGEQLLRAIQSQRVVGGRIGTCLLEMEVLSEEHLLEALSKQLGVPAAGVDKLRGIDEEILSLVPAKLAVRSQAIPFAAGDNEIHVATLNVRHLQNLDEISFISSRQVRPHIANEVRIFEALERYYGEECPRRYGHLLDRLNRSRFLWATGTDQRLDLSEMEIDWNEPGDVFRDDRMMLAPSAGPRSTAASPEFPGSITARPVRTPPAPPAPANEATRAPAEAPRPTPAPEGLLSLKQVEHFLSNPNNEGRTIGQVLLRYLAQSFTTTGIFKVQHGFATGWLAHGLGVDGERFSRLELELEEPSAIQTLERGGPLYRGPLAPMPAHRRMAESLSIQLGQDCVMVPVRVRGRLVSVFYGDRGPRGLRGLKTDQLKRLAEKAAMAFELCILRRKIQDS